MPRLPIIGALIAACLLAPTAHAAVVVRSIDDLRSDPAVAAAELKFLTIAKSGTIYTHCATEYAVTPAQQAYYQEAIQRLARDYSAAYYQAYTTKVGAAPTQKVVDYYTQFISTLQQNTLASTEAMRARNGCAHYVLKKNYLDAEKQRIEEEAAAKNNGKKKKYDPWAPAPAAAPMSAAPAAAAPAPASPTPTPPATP